MIAANTEGAISETCVAPYPGLRSFRRDEANIFFGRDEQVDDLLDRLSESRLLAVTGESGCGKSSLVRAGLIPALEAGFLSSAKASWRVAEVLHPGERPMQRLAAALLKAVGVGPGSDESVAIAAAKLRRGPLGVSHFLNEHPLPIDTELLILIDQFEELIRYRDSIDADEADAFVALILRTVVTSLPVRVVLTLRTDYLGECAVFRGLPEALSRSQYLTPRLTREQLSQAIRSPARVFGGEVDDALTNHLINEVGRCQDQLPIVQHALMWMWTRRSPKRETTSDGESSPTLTLSDYDDIGSLGKALSSHADQVYLRLTTEQRGTARRLFCGLWDGNADADSRQPRRLDEALAIIGAQTSLGELRAVADAFRAPEHCFLLPLAATPPAATVPLAVDDVLDVSHESLFRHWATLEEWTRQEARDAEDYRDFRNRASGHRSGERGLLIGADLQAAADWLARVRPNSAWARQYSSSAEDFEATLAFIQRSQQEECARETARRQVDLDNQRLVERRRRLRIALMSLAVAALAVMPMGIFWVLAEGRRRELEAFDAASAKAAMQEPQRALQIVLASRHLQHEKPGESVQATVRQALRNSPFRSLILASKGTFTDARLLPDGRVITIGEGDGLAVWDSRSGLRERAAFGRDVNPRQLAVDAKGQQAASGGVAGSIDLWTIGSCELRKTLEGHLGAVNGLAFSADGFRLASASDDGSARIWNIDSGAQERAFYDHLGPVTALAFTYDGERLATAGADRRVILWDLRTGRKLRTLVFGGDAFGAISFDSSGSMLAGTQGNDVRLWDAITGRTLGAIDHGARTLAVAFSPDGSLGASVGADAVLRVWDRRSQTVLMRYVEEPALNLLGLSSPGSGARSADFGSTLVQGAAQLSGDAGGALAASEPGFPMTPDAPAANGHQFRSVAFAPSGLEVITTGSDGSAKIWSVVPNEEMSAFRAHSGGIEKVAFNRDGTLFASAGADGTVAVWDFVPASTPSSGGRWEPPRELLRTPSVGSSVNAIAFDPDGKRLAVGRPLWPLTDDGVLRTELALWSFDSKTPELLDVSFQLPEQRVDDAVFYDLPGGERRIAAAAGRSLYVFDVATGERRFVLEANTDVFALAVSRDGQLIAAQCMQHGAQGVCSWGAHSGGVPHWLAPFDPPAFALTFERGSRSLVVAGAYGSLTRSTLDSAGWTSSMIGHHGAVYGAALSPDGELLATSGADAIRVWSATRAGSANDFPNAPPGGKSVAFSPKGRHLVAAGRDGFVRTYALDWAELLGAAEARVPLALTEGECKRYASGCSGIPSDVQIANRRRLDLRRARATEAYDPEQNPPNEGPLKDWLLPDESRFATARLVAAAVAAVQTPLDRTAIVARGVDSALSASELPLVALAKAIESGSERSRQLLEAAQRADPGLRLNPSTLPDQIAEDWLLVNARLLASDGTSEGAERLLRLVPGRLPEWSAQTAAAMVPGEVIRAVRESEATELSRALARLSSLTRLSLLPTDPRFMPWLRVAIPAYAAAKRYDDVVELAGLAVRVTDDSQAALEFGQALGATGNLELAKYAFERALELDPINDEARSVLAGTLDLLQQPRRAFDLFRSVSPDSMGYDDAATSAGYIAFEKLQLRDEGYRLMAMVASGRDALAWANLAEASLATERVLQARLIARRVLEGRAVDNVDPHVELAMRTVLVCALARSLDVSAAHTELEALVARVASANLEGSSKWSYAGSRAAAARLGSGAQRRFVQTLIDFVESKGERGTEPLLHDLLDQTQAPETSSAPSASRAQIPQARARSAAGSTRPPAGGPTRSWRRR